MPEPNQLFYGDNLDILRHHIADESVDLIYLDPPFNSNRNYNVLFREKSGESSPAQIQAFTDTWEWDRAAEAAFDDLVETGPHNVATMISAMREFVGRNDMMAYLVMMAQRLVELHRVLKSTGSLYLHCDPTASHYLKILLDTVFGKSRYMSEISWKRSSAHNDSTQGRRNMGHIRDVVLFYSKSSDYTWNPLFSAYDEKYIEDFYRHIEPDTGRRFRLSDLTAAKGGGDTSYDWKGVQPYKVVSGPTHVSTWKSSIRRADSIIRVPGCHPISDILTRCRVFHFKMIGTTFDQQAVWSDSVIRLRNLSPYWNALLKQVPTPAMSCWIRSAAAARRSSQRRSAAADGSGSTSPTSRSRS